jgi:hypothetical protein
VNLERIKLSADLQSIRANLIEAQSIRALQISFYEINDLLSKYPASVDAKILRDDIRKAINIETAQEIRPPKSVCGIPINSELTLLWEWWESSFSSRKTYLLILVSVLLSVAVISFTWRSDRSQVKSPVPTPSVSPATPGLGSQNIVVEPTFVKTYQQNGAVAKLGKPISQAESWQGGENHPGETGLIQKFSGGVEGQGAIIKSDNSTQSFWVGGVFWLVYMKNKEFGGVKSILSAPTSNRYPTNGGWRQDFKDYSAILEKSNKIFSVYGGIGEHYLKKEEGEKGRLGFPTSMELGRGGKVIVQEFEHGCIHYGDVSTYTMIRPRVC